jgi:hypothetical protein
VFHRYPIFRSSASERRTLFERRDERRSSPAEVTVSRFEPASIVPQQP